MANFSVLASFWIIKISQANERSTEEKNRGKNAILAAVRSHFGRLYFVQRAKSPCENPIFGSGSKLLSDQVLMEVYCHSHKHLKFASQIRMPCEFHGVANFMGRITISQGLRNFGKACEISPGLADSEIFCSML